MNESKVNIAVGLIPICKYLNKAGIISIYENRVQCRLDFFKDTFPVFETIPLDEDYDELRYTYNGAVFFTLFKKNVD